MAKLTAFFLSLILFFTSFFGAGSGRSVDRSEKIANNEFARAGYSLAALLADNCYDALKGQILGNTDGNGVPYVWPASSFVEAMADAYRLFPGSAKLRQAYAGALKRGFARYLTEDEDYATPTKAQPISYYNSSAGGRGSFYYDDNAWVCIQLLFGYQNLGDRSLLAAAKDNLEFLWSGWDDTLGGGIYWSSGFTSKNTCANAPSAIAFLLAYQITGDETYLDRGRQIYDWTNRTLRRNDLFDDCIALNGNVDRWNGAYNQATMIYAGSLLYEITGDGTCYDLTKATVNATIPLMFKETQTETGERKVTMNVNPIFKAWCIGWLVRSYVKFYETDPEKDDTALNLCIAVMRDELATKDENGLYDPYFCSGGADAANYKDLLQQCGAAAAILNTAYYDAVLTPGE